MDEQHPHAHPHRPRFHLSLALRTFRPALPAAFTTLALLVSCTLAHAQIIDSTYILAVDRRVQEIDAAKDHEIRTLENEEFLEQMTDGGGHLKGFVKNGQLVKMESWVGVYDLAEGASLLEGHPCPPIKQPSRN